MWKRTTRFHPGVSRFFLRLFFRAGVLGAVFLSEAAWAKWPINPPLEATYVDWEDLSIGVSGKAPPHFLLSSISQSRSSSERLARLDAAERLFFLVRELRLSGALKMGECVPESQLREGLASLLLSRAPTARWRFLDGGQSLFFKLSISLLAPFCPELAEAKAKLSALSGQEKTK